MTSEFAFCLESGDRALREGRYADAEHALTAALALEPRSVKAHFKLGLVLERVGQWARAEAAFRAAVRWKRDHAVAWLRLAALPKVSVKYGIMASSTRGSTGVVA